MVPAEFLVPHRATPSAGKVLIATLHISTKFRCLSVILPHPNDQMTSLKMTDEISWALPTIEFKELNKLR